MTAPPVRIVNDRQFAVLRRFAAGYEYGDIVADLPDVVLAAVAAIVYSLTRGNRAEARRLVADYRAAHPAPARPDSRPTSHAGPLRGSQPGRAIEVGRRFADGLVTGAVADAMTPSPAGPAKQSPPAVLAAHGLIDREPQPEAMAVACPRCGKGPLERCIDTWGMQTSSPHVARRKAGAAQAAER